jgi:hypothetical protein
MMRERVLTLARLHNWDGIGFAPPLDQPENAEKINNSN